MSCFRYSAAALVFSSSLSAQVSPSEAAAPRIQRAQLTDTNEFTDPIYGYSLNLPTTWKPYPRTSSEAEPPKRLSLSTPNKNTVIVSVYRLPRAITRHSE